jgi:hypothetical protein
MKNSKTEHTAHWSQRIPLRAIRKESDVGPTLVLTELPLLMKVHTQVHYLIQKLFSATTRVSVNEFWNLRGNMLHFRKRRANSLARRTVILCRHE